MFSEDSPASEESQPIPSLDWNDWITDDDSDYCDFGPIGFVGTIGGQEDHLEDIGDRFVEFQMPGLTSDDEDSGRDSAYEDEDFDSEDDCVLYGGLRQPQASGINYDFRRLNLEPIGTGDRVEDRVEPQLHVQGGGESGMDRGVGLTDVEDYNNHVPGTQLPPLHQGAGIHHLGQREGVTYESYFEGMVNNVWTRIIIDGGNLLPNGTAISLRFMREAGLRFKNRNRRDITTARRGSPLKMMGISEPFSIAIPGFRQPLLVSEPIVLDGLSDNVNIGAGTLQAHEMDIAYRKGGTALRSKDGQEELPLISKLTDNQDQSEEEDNTCKNCFLLMSKKKGIPPRKTRKRNQGAVNAPKPDNFEDVQTKLVRDLAPDKGTKFADHRTSRSTSPTDKGSRRRESGPTREQKVTDVLASKEVILPAKSLCFVKLEALGKSRDVVVEPVWETSLVQPLPAVYKGCVKSIGMLNLSTKSVVIKKGMRIGQARKAELQEECPDISKLSEADEGYNSDEDNARTEAIMKGLKVEENVLVKRNPGLVDKIRDLVHRFNRVFSEPDSEIGTTDLLEFEIELKAGTKPVKQRLRPLNPTQLDSLKSQLDLWLEQGVIEPTTSPWASPMVPVKKRGQTKIRWCVDYRLLNEATVSDAYPLPSIKENLDSLAGCNVFSTLDASAGYHCLRVSEETKPCLSFTSPFGLYTYSRMPFGPTNAVATYSRFMALVVGRLNSNYVHAYLDDVIVATPDVELHLKELERTLQAHEEAGIKLRVSKTHLFQEQTNYLGFLVSTRGVEMQPSYLEQILNWPVPANAKELKSFLGFAGYYREFIKDFSWLTNEMNSAKGKKVKFVWTETMNTKFKKLKKLFGEKPIRAYPKFGIDEAPFELAVDFSGTNVAAVLSQKQDGVERLIAAKGRKTTKYESNYPSTKGELCAVLFGLRKYEEVLRYRKFILHTDNSALVYMKNIKCPTGLWARWLQEVGSYSFDVFHRAGAKNTNADGLSRASHLPAAHDDDEGYQSEIDQSYEYDVNEWDEHKKDMKAELEAYRKKKSKKKLKHLPAAWPEVVLGEQPEISAIGGGDADGEADPEEEQALRDKLLPAQKADPTLRVVRKWLERGKIPKRREIAGETEDVKVYHQVADQLAIEDSGLLIQTFSSRRREHFGVPIRRICVPTGDKRIMDEIWQHGHAHPTAGHFGINATCLRIAERWYYPSMSADIQRRCRQCPNCLAKIQKVRAKACQPVHATENGFPGERIYIDLVGPLPLTNENRYILSVQCGFTKFAQAYPIRNKEAETTANCLVNHWISTHGCPGSVHSDQGSEFRNKVWKSLCDRLQIKQTQTSAPENQNSNLVERFHRTLNAIMRAYQEREDIDWLRILPMAVLAYNSKVHSSTKITPFEAWFGRRARLPLDLILTTPEPNFKSADAYVAETLSRFGQMYSWMRHNNKAAFHRNARLYSGEDRKWELEDLCWVFRSQRVRGKPLKHTDRWVGPYRVVKAQDSVIIHVMPALTKGKVLQVHVNRLAPYHGTGRHTKVRYIDDDVNLDDDVGDDAAEIIGEERDLFEDLTIPVERSELRVPVLIPEDVPDIQDIGRAAAVPIETKAAREKRKLDQLSKTKEKKAKAVREPVVARPKRKATTEAAAPLVRKGARTEGTKREAEDVLSDDVQRELKLARGSPEDTPPTTTTPSVASASGAGSSRRQQSVPDPMLERRTERDRSRDRGRGEKPKVRLKDYDPTNVLSTTDSDEDTTMRVGERKTAHGKMFKAHSKELYGRKKGGVGRLDTDSDLSKLTLEFSMDPVTDPTALCAGGYDGAALSDSDTTAFVSQPHQVSCASGTVPDRQPHQRGSYVRSQETVLLPACCTSRVPLQLTVDPGSEQGVLIIGSPALDAKAIHVHPIVLLDRNLPIELIITNFTEDQYKIQRGERVATAFVIPITSAQFVKQCLHHPASRDH